METVRSFIKRHSILTYYILTFTISWGAVLALILWNGLPATQKQLDAQLPVAILAMLLGPSMVSILLMGILDGKAGFRELFCRLRKWRAGIQWLAIAFLVGPLVLLVVPLVLSLLSPVYQPGIVVSDNKPALIFYGILGGLVVGLFEELGWTGFVTPRLRLRHSVLSTGLIAGVIWGAWHILSNDIWAIHTISGALPPTTYVIVNGLGFLIGQLVPFRILMVWVYEHTESLLLAILMHASLTASTFILGPLAIAGMPLLIYDLGLAIVMWSTAVVILIVYRKQFKNTAGQK